MKVGKSAMYSRLWPYHSLPPSLLFSLFTPTVAREISFFSLHSLHSNYLLGMLMAVRGWVLDQRYILELQRCASLVSAHAGFLPENMSIWTCQRNTHPTISYRRYKEMMLAPLEKKHLRLSPIDMRFHLHDRICSGHLKTISTPSGLVVRVSKD